MWASYGGLNSIAHLHILCYDFDASHVSEAYLDRALGSADSAGLVGPMFGQGVGRHLMGCLGHGICLQLLNTVWLKYMQMMHYAEEASYKDSIVNHSIQSGISVVLGPARSPIDCQYHERHSQKSTIK